MRRPVPLKVRVEGGRLDAIHVAAWPRQNVRIQATLADFAHDEIGADAEPVGNLASCQPALAGLELGAVWGRPAAPLESHCE